jgi:hypothetical protein
MLRASFRRASITWRGEHTRWPRPDGGTGTAVRPTAACRTIVLVHHALGIPTGVLVHSDLAVRVPISDSAESQDAGCSEEMSRHSAKVLQKKVRRSFEPPRASFCRSILTFADPFSCLQGKGALAAGLHRRDGGIWLIRCSCRSTLVSAMRCGYFRRCKRQRWLWLGLFSRCAV